MTQRLPLVLLSIALVATACSRSPNFEALCAKAAPCEHQPASFCVAALRRLYEAQDARGRGAEGAAVVACKIEHGQCETSGSMSLFMPTDACRPAILELGACFDRTRN